MMFVFRGSCFRVQGLGVPGPAETNVDVEVGLDSNSLPLSSL